MISFTVNLYVLFQTFFVVEGTLTPDGTGPLDCGSQRSFTCSVTGGAAWNISGLSGINVPAIPTGRSIADINGRIDTTDTSGATQSSTITITGFTTLDNGGTIQCFDLGDNSVQGMASISVEPPSCPTSFSANRDGDFTSATVTYQLATTPPVTSTTVTYCPTSSPNCGNSMNCSSTGTCTISRLDPCVEYKLAAIPNNNCGSRTGCTGNSVFVSSRGVPSCPLSMVAVAHDDNDAITVTWQQHLNTSTATSTTVTYCPTSSPNCGNSVNCTSPCTISGLDPGTEYQFIVIPNNNCGSPTGCTKNNATAETACICPKCTLQSSPSLEAPLLAGIIPTVLLLLANVVTGVVVFLITRHCYKKTSQKSSPLKGEGVYDQVEGPKTYEDIVMTDSPAYGPVK